MSKCPGTHCPGCGKGSGGLALLAVVIVGGLITANRHAIESGVSEIVTVIMLTVLAVVSLAVAAVITYAAVRIGRHYSVGSRLALSLRAHAYARGTASRARAARLAAPATRPGVSVGYVVSSVTEPHRAAIDPPRSLPLDTAGSADVVGQRAELR